MALSITVACAMIDFLLKSSVLTFITTLFCLWLLYPIALQVGLTDHPGGRKIHDGKTPLIGGIAIFFGMCFGLLTLHISLSEYRGMLGGAGLLLLMGIADDFKDISQSLRLVGQLIASLLLIVWGGHQLVNLGSIFFTSDVLLGLWAVPLTILVVICYINAFNMIDGQDGLAGGVALIQLVTLSIFLYQQGQVFATLVLVIVSVATFAFLCLNMPLPWRKSAKVFMGDSGSTVLAFIIIWFALQLSQSGVHHFRPVDAVWVISYPFFDCVQVVTYRLMQGKSPLEADREHLHHLMLELGMSRIAINTWIMALTISLIVLGWLFNYLQLSSGVVFIVWLLSLLIYVSICNVWLKKHVELNANS